MYFHWEWKTLWIHIRWLRQKPDDLDLQCFKKEKNLGSAGQRLNYVYIINHSIKILSI